MDTDTTHFGKHARVMSSRSQFFGMVGEVKRIERDTKYPLKDMIVLQLPAVGEKKILLQYVMILED